jgi:pseudouridine synthase
MTAQRLQKIMAMAGIASRRACEEVILAGRVTVDGVVVRELGTKVDPSVQDVAVDGVALVRERPVVFILNKPRGVICSVGDPEGRPTVLDLLKDEQMRLYPVGRLDFNTSGALLLTNDGELAHALTHPKFGAEKRYLIKFHGIVSDAVLEIWRNGVVLEDGTRTQRIREIARVEESDGGTWVHVVLKEGKNRQIRRMAEATGLQVSKLKRVAFAGITIDGLPIGRYRRLTPKELKTLLDTYDIARRDFVNLDRPRKTGAVGRSVARDDEHKDPRTRDRKPTRATEKMPAGSKERRPARATSRERVSSSRPAGARTKSEARAVTPRSRISTGKKSTRRA